MTPQEKARELVDKYWSSEPEMTLRMAKQCAIICCEEVIANNPSRRYWDTYDDETPSAITFYQEVIEEINKL